MNKKYPFYQSAQIDSLKDLVKNCAASMGDCPAFSYRKGRHDILRRSFRQVETDMNGLGTFLFRQSLIHTHIAILGENSYEWIIAFLAITAGGNTAAAIDKDLPSDEISKTIQDSGCSAVFCSKEYMDKTENLSSVPVFSLDNLQEYIRIGLSEIEAGNRSFVSAEIDVQQPAAIFFTSGTTGEKKGVVLTHKNIASDISFACQNVYPPGNTLAVLPFHHTFGLITAIFMPMNYGRETFINKSLRMLPKDLKTAQPTMMFLVPLFVETFHKQIMDAVRKKHQESTFRRLKTGVSALQKINIDISRQVFSSVLEPFGSKLEYIVCGGAPLNEQYIKDFRSIGIKVLNGYGITECSPVVSVNRNRHWKDGSVGLVIPGCQVKIGQDGEVFVKGDNVMAGYYGDAISTQNALQNGWFATGDLGRIDQDGFLFLTGRKKNLILLSNGENLSPELLEQKIAADEAAEEVIVYGDGQQIAACIYPAEAYRGNTEYFEHLIRRVNSTLSQNMQISRVELRDEPFEKSATQKILRHKTGGNQNV